MHSHSGPSCWRLCHHQLMASRVTWPPTSSQQMEDCLGGFYGPVLDAMYMTSIHIPLARAQSMVPFLCKGNWKSSPWQGGCFLAILRGNHKPWWPDGHFVTASQVILMCGEVENHWSRASRHDENIIPTLPCPISTAMELWMNIHLGGHAF